ncbi:MAG: ORC1-type DNA replication protein [Nanoarchaeota archaeon]|nr:ORC1-type DNA replication protein [Nanoarchaeota archaeon]
MVEKEVSSYFENYLKQEPLFIKKKVLQSNYNPENIIHRSNEIKKLASILAPSLRFEKPSNIFLYGKTGTGKTLISKHVANYLHKIANKNNVPLKIFYLNCKLKRIADTEYRLIAEMTRQFDQIVPATGLPTDEVYRLFLKALDKEKIMLIIILDEIDQLLNKAGDEILYNLTRISSELSNSEVSIIGISNDLMFTNYLDPRVRSSLSEEEILFPPYNAIQLKSILKERAKEAFREGAIAEGVLEKCAAYAAREHGDARRALELLRVAGEITERKNERKVMISSLDEAEEKIERDRIYDIVSTQPKQQQITLYSIFKLCSVDQKKPVVTGDVYALYKDFCFKLKIRPLTQRRISDIIAELDMLGIINAKVISHGRYGRTRQICIGISPSTAPKISKLLGEVLDL